MSPRVSVIVPALNEGEAIRRCLDRLTEAMGALDYEVLVVFDSPDDTTSPPATEYARRDPRVRPTLNRYGPGPANALRYGFDQASAPVVVVTMADGSDEVDKIPQLVDLVEEGAAIAAPSRYMAGGQQRGGPRLKRALSRAAGLSLYWLARVGTHDATNSFKAYRKSFVQTVGIESSRGFAVGIELVAKARKVGEHVVEVPTRWSDRQEGTSSFRVLRWLPEYLKWWFYALEARWCPFDRGRSSQREPLS